MTREEYMIIGVLHCIRECLWENKFLVDIPEELQRNQCDCEAVPLLKIKDCLDRIEKDLNGGNK